MGYIHRGASHDFGDTPTDYGKGLADKFDEVHEENKRKAEQLYKEDLRIWEREVIRLKQRNKNLEKEYQQKLKQWEDDCKNSFLGFLKKLLHIKKPKLELSEIPSKPEWDY